MMANNVYKLLNINMHPENNLQQLYNDRKYIINKSVHFCNC